MWRRVSLGVYHWVSDTLCADTLCAFRCYDAKKTSISMFNKYMIWRVRASWTKVTNRIGFLDNECSFLETRLQVKF